MIGTSDCPDVATPFIAANFARETDGERRRAI
jgi:hypothetical protein